MQKKSELQAFNRLRKEFQFFIYEDFTFETIDQSLKVTFFFNLSGRFTFKPQLIIPLNDGAIKHLSHEALSNLVFHIGMIELISYWKAACPPVVIIRPYNLPAEAQKWWKKLWFKGLGEFFYLNGIHIDEKNFLEIVSESKKDIMPFSLDAGEKVLVPVGGGKDSVVTLELLKHAGVQTVPFMLNPRAAGWNTLQSASFSKEEAMIAQRTIDPKLLELNGDGFLNGHTPFSALLAFTTLLAGGLSGIKHIALSNESSANEATIPETQINHQYSKSWEFECDFRTYTKQFISPDFNYFSFLRPLNELQIAGLFTKFPAHFSTFRSCNAGSRINIWCGKCPKCLFTAIVLSPFLERETLHTIFGKDITDDTGLKNYFDALTGEASEKPFECVGTIGEVRAAVVATIKNNSGEKHPALFESFAYRNFEEKNVEYFLSDFNHHHFLTGKFLEILQKALHATSF
jgi:UDP-N-acetyl-alpha-D-muramoyl-L-alanyl-L-glutamate epimerase